MSDHLPQASGEQLLNRADSVPLGTQLKSIIREKISTGAWAPNTMIPSENRLSEMYGISRKTARNVISQFVSQGFLYRIPGKGTFVCETKYEINSLQYAGLRGQLEAQGHNVTTRLISWCRFPACSTTRQPMMPLRLVISARASVFGT